MRKTDCAMSVKIITLRKNETVATQVLPFLPVNNDAVIIDDIPYVVSFREWIIEDGRLKEVAVRVSGLDLETVMNAAGLPF